MLRTRYVMAVGALWLTLGGVAAAQVSASSAVDAALRGRTTARVAPAPSAPSVSPGDGRARAIAAALTEGDSYRAALLGASAADIVRFEQSQGRLFDINPQTAALTVRPDGTVIFNYAIRQLPSLPGETGPTRSLIETADPADEPANNPPQPILLRPPGVGLPTSELVRPFDPAVYASGRAAVGIGNIPADVLATVEGLRSGGTSSIGPVAHASGKPLPEIPPEWLHPASAGASR